MSNNIPVGSSGLGDHQIKSHEKRCKFCGRKPEDFDLTSPRGRRCSNNRTDGGYGNHVWEWVEK